MDVNFLIDILSSTGVIISVFYLAKQVKNASQVHKDNHEWNRRIETKHALDSYNRLDSVMLLNESFNYMGERHSINKDLILEKFKQEPDLKIHLVRLLNFYEGLANGIDMSLYNEVIIKEARRGNMIRTYKAFEDFINFHRADVNKLAFIKYEALVRKWEDEGKQTIKLHKLGV